MQREPRGLWWLGHVILGSETEKLILWIPSRPSTRASRKWTNLSMEMLSCGAGSWSGSCPSGAVDCCPQTVPAPDRLHPGSHLPLLPATPHSFSSVASKGLPSQRPCVPVGAGWLALCSGVQSLSLAPKSLNSGEDGFSISSFSCLPWCVSSTWRRPLSPVLLPGAPACSVIKTVTSCT